MKKPETSIEQIRNWWNRNPYTYGTSTQGLYRDVGPLVLDGVGANEVFAKYEKKYSKHLRESLDGAGRLAGRFIPYDDIVGKRVLDVACGYGWASIAMAQNGCDVFAIDLTPAAVTFTSQYASFKGLKVATGEMSAEEISFPDSYFDFVLGWGFVMHTEKPEVALKEMIRVLKPGGQLVVYFYYRHSISFWWNIFFLRGILLGYLFKYRGDVERLTSRFTDGQSFGGNAKTLCLSRKWFRHALSGEDNISLYFQGWGPPSLLDSFPVSKFPMGKLFPRRLKNIWSKRFGFGHILTVTKLV